MIGVVGGRWRAPTVEIAQAAADSREGLRIEFVIDTFTAGNDPKAELEQVLTMVGWGGMVGAVGPAGSRAALVTAPVFNEAEILQIVPTGTSRSLADAGEWTFTLAPNDSVEGAVIGTFVSDSLQARSATLFYLTDEYGYGLRDGVLAALQQRGVEVLDAVPMPPLYQIDDTRSNDVESIVQAALAKGEPDVVVLAVRDYSTRILVPYLLEAIPQISFVAGDGALLRGQNRVALESSMDRIYQTVFWNPDPLDSEAQSFIREYHRITGVDPGHDEALHYDGLLLLAEAAKAVGPDTGRMREYLLSLGRERAPFQGITGPISFGQDHPPSVTIIRSDRLSVR